MAGREEVFGVQELCVELEPGLPHLSEEFNSEGFPALGYVGAFQDLHFGLVVRRSPRRGTDAQGGPCWEYAC